jgi:hypothetical protein
VLEVGLVEAFINKSKKVLQYRFFNPTRTNILFL